MQKVFLAIAFIVATATPPAYAAMSKDAAVAECRAIYRTAFKRGDADTNAKFTACVKQKMRGQ